MFWLKGSGGASSAAFTHIALLLYLVGLFSCVVDIMSVSKLVPDSGFYLPLKGIKRLNLVVFQSKRGISMKKTPFYDWHKEHGTIVDFCGWALPVQYKGMSVEHMAVREAAGVFDVSHMGRFTVKGEHAEALIDSLVPRDVSAMEDGKCGYSYVMNEKAGFRDDIIISKIKDEDFYIVCNASNKEKIVAWFKTHAALLQAYGLTPPEVVDLSDEVAMFALQGPKAFAIMEAAGFPNPPTTWRVAFGNIAGHDIMLTGTGYTGEKGFEVYVPFKDVKEAIEVWDFIMKTGESFGIHACGLGCRDTLRLEAGLSLYGNEIEEDITPLEAKLDFVPFYKLEKKRNFMSRDLLRELTDKPLTKERVGFVCLDKGVPRHEYKIFDESGTKEIGIVTSGSISPLLKVGLGLGYVPPEHAKIGTKIRIQVRKKLVLAEVRGLPLYDPDVWGRARKS